MQRMKERMFLEASYWCSNVLIASSDSYVLIEDENVITCLIALFTVDSRCTDVANRLFWNGTVQGLLGNT